MKKFYSLSALASILLLTVVFISCENEDGDPDYVGTWINEETETFFEQIITVRSTLVLTKSTFDMAMDMVASGVAVPMAGMKGGLSVSGENITVTPNSVGMVEENETTLTWINKGDSGWEDALAEMEMDETETATYKVEGNQLTITFDDDDEMVYTKQ
jgi:hypothetical protein